MEIPGLGAVTKDKEFDWLYSKPMKVRALRDNKCRLVLEGYETDRHKDDFHTAIQNFLMIDDAPLNKATNHIFEYYQDCAEMNAEMNAAEHNLGIPLPELEFPRIETPDEVWGYLELGTEPLFTRRAYGDKGIYVSLECHCDWEEEHGLQIVFKNGLVVNKVGSYDGHVTNSDAYGKKSLDNVVYHRIRG